MSTNIYDLSVTDRTGVTVPLSVYKGKVLLLVNTATGCGFTPQYEDLEKIYSKFCTMKFGTEFPQFKKIDVNGETADPLFVRLATALPFEGFGHSPKALMLKPFADKNNKQFGDKAYIMWNFTKFLVDREGNLVSRFEPTVDMKKVEAAIKNLVESDVK